MGKKFRNGIVMEKEGGAHSQTVHPKKKEKSNPKATNVKQIPHF